jgi:hypothetical protein
MIGESIYHGDTEATEFESWLPFQKARLPSYGRKLGTVKCHAQANPAAKISKFEIVHPSPVISIPRIAPCEAIMKMRKPNHAVANNPN